MFPYLAAAIVIIGLPTIYVAVRFREYRKFLVGAFFVSSGMQIYFYLAKIPIPLMWTNAIQSPDLSGVRGAIHFPPQTKCLKKRNLSKFSSPGPGKLRNSDFTCTCPRSR
jgi:hypothetical protein